MTPDDIHDQPHRPAETCGELQTGTLMPSRCDRAAGHSGPHRAGTATHVEVEWGWASGPPCPAGRWP